LRAADGDAADGALEELKRIIKQIRQSWSKVHILVRADSDFCREKILTWCERNGIDYVIGFAKNDGIIGMIDAEEAKQKWEKTARPARIFKDIYYRTRESWSRRRRVIAKAEHLEKGSNPRFVVTSLPKHGFEAALVYEVLYWGRGEMENRIKEQQLGLFADRTSTATMRGNQIRFTSRQQPTCSCTLYGESV